MFRLWALGILLACSNAQIQRLPDCADCSRGELRHGLHTRDGEGSIAALPGGGVVALERRAVVFYDRAMREHRRVELSLGDAALVATTGDDTYVLRRSGRELELIAIDHRGVRWRETLGRDPGPALGDNGLGAGPDGPFVYGALELALPGAAARGQQIVALARDGALRWRQSFDGARPTLVADPSGGAYVITDEHAAGGSEIAVRHLDRTGRARWTQTIAAAALARHRLVEAAGSTARVLALAGVFSGARLSFGARPAVGDGGIDGALDARPAVGDGGIDGAPGARWTSYLAVLDEDTGAPAWARVIGDDRYGGTPTQLAAIPSGEIAVASVRSSSETSAGESSLDTVIQLVGATGVVSATSLTGTGDQIARSMAASDDGSVWLSLTSFENELFPDGATLVIGSQRFIGQGLYVLNLLP